MPVATAASVAAELLAFHREPVVHRPRYLHGEKELPAGHVVLRLALGRFPHGWARDLSRGERDEVRTAALEFVRQVCLWDRASHYQVLCLPLDAARDGIRENYQLLIALLHPDRQEPGAAAWPIGCAQRVNQAYETLADPRARAEYDAGLRAPQEAHEARPRETANVARHRRARAATGPGSLGKRAAIVGGVIATLFVVQSWWVGGLEPEHSLLERSMPTSARWSGAPADSPRFLGHVPIDVGPRLEPIKEPRRLVALAEWVPAPVDERAAAPAPERVAPQPPSPPAAPAAPPSPSTAAPLRVASALGVARPNLPVPATAVPAASAPAASARPVASVDPPLRVAQAGSAPPPVSDIPSRDQVEGVVALLVGFYDAGDSERLVGLVDPDALGWWQGYRMRTAYADFFGSTRARKLRMERLTWRNNGTIAEARGEATVVADYADGRARLERRLPVEIDIAMRAGAARITRIVLFPGE